VRNTQAFKDAVAQTLAELARLGVTLRPGAVGDIVEQNVNAVAQQLHIQPRSAWQYFDATALAQALAAQAREHEQAGEDTIGQPPYPPLENPELAMILAAVPDALHTTGGDLYNTIVQIAVNAWMAGHVHGEDGCPGCAQANGRTDDWATRQRTIATMLPGYAQWFDRDHFTRALHDSGFTITPL
jgi:hypothetical protein